MSQLYKLIENIIEKSIKNYSEKIIREYDNVCEKKLEELWKKTLFELEKTTNKKEGKEVEKTTNKKEGKEVEKDEKKDRKCPYEFSKGKRKGEICNVKLTIGKEFCSTHNKSEVKKDKINNSVSSEDSEQKKETESKKIDNNYRILKKNKEYNCWWNSYTGMVFKNNQERIVIGRIKGCNKCKLNKEDIEDCKKWNYQYEISTEEEDGKKRDCNILNEEDIIEKSVEDILGIITNNNSSEE